MAYGYNRQSYMLGTTQPKTCRPFDCELMQQFSVFYSELFGEKLSEDRVTEQLFRENCRTFHDEVGPEVDEWTQQWFAYVVNIISLDIHPNAKNEFIRILCEIQANKDVVKKVTELIAEQRKKYACLPTISDKPNSTASSVKPDGLLQKHLSLLDAIAKNLVNEWNSIWTDISLQSCCGPDGQHEECAERFFRMNIRCRIINYVRERLPVMDFQKRIQILNDLKKATSFMQMLPLLGCGFLTFVDYPVDRCIFKGGNGCCALANATKNLQRGSIAGAVNSRFAVQFAMSDLSIFTWKSSSAYNLINEKPRMRYTNSFMK